MDSIAIPLEPATWVDEHGDYLYRFALARVGAPEAAEDLVQQTLLAALVARHSFQGLAGERTWLTAILKRKVADWLGAELRRSIREEHLPDERADTAFTRGGHWRKHPGEWSPEAPGRELHRAEFQSTLARCLGKLPSRLRDAFVLKYVDEGTTGEVCRNIGATSTNLAVMLHRARMRLWQCLTVNWFEEDPETLAEGRKR